MLFGYFFLFQFIIEVLNKFVFKLNMYDETLVQGLKYVAFNHQDMGSNPIGLNIYHGFRLRVDHSSSKRFVPIRIRQAVHYRVSNLIGKGLSCQESRCRIVAGLTRIT